jgi:uncharacterized membrane protein YebE (DUF533 family)
LRIKIVKISSPNAPEPTPEELKELEKLKAIIERAIADGKLSQSEAERIQAAIRSDKKVTFEELTLIRELIYNKIDRGELEREWD